MKKQNKLTKKGELINIKLIKRLVMLENCKNEFLYFSY